MAQRDASLDAFDGLRVRVVKASNSDVPLFLVEFQSAAASLEPEERIELGCMHEKSLELLKAVLADPQAGKVCALFWAYSGEEDVNSIIPLLVHSCPELVSLRVYFEHHSAFDFVSSVLEHPSNKIKVLQMPPNTKGDIPRFFAALAQSQVSALTLSNCHFPELYQGLFQYLAKDLLVRLQVWMNYGRVPPEMMMSLAGCTRLTELKLAECKFSQPSAFPQSITKLVLDECTFVRDFDWSFLVGSGVRELDLSSVRGVDGNQLAVHLRAVGLDKLRLRACDFVNETLVGLELGRIKRLDIGSLNDASVALIALTLQSPNSELRELVLPYYGTTMSSIDNHLVPALKRPNCSLAKLSLWTYQQELQVAAKRMEDTFHSRLALFVLLQGQQVRRLYCPLRRLPVEMFRLVGEVLLI